MSTWLTDENGNRCNAEIAGETRGDAFTLETFHRNIPETDLFQNLFEMWGKLGRQPKFRDCYPGLSAYSAHTYAYRFGSWRRALAAFITWCGQNGVEQKQLETPTRSPRTPRQVNLKLRAEILMRDFSTCQLCGAQPKDGAKLEIDHIIPWASGGETTMGNLQTLCVPCNKGKSDSAFYDSNEDALADIKRLAGVP